jgi:hypothetical protein
MQDIAAQSGQEYVDEYASRKKRPSPEPTAGTAPVPPDSPAPGARTGKPSS